MRILHMDSGKDMRGGQWQVLRLIEGLAKAGVESTLLARAGSPLFESARKQAVPVEPFGLIRAARLSRQYDLVHAHDARSHSAAALVGADPLVVSRRVAFSIGNKSFLSRWKYDRAAHYMAVSERVKSVLVSGGVPARKISVVYDGVPLLPQSTGTKVLALEKENTLATEAAALANVPLQMAADLESDLPAAGIFVYITHNEGLGSGVLMAMSAGVAVIASKIGGLPEVIEHRKNGLLVENTPQSIAGALRELAADPGLAQQLGNAARRTVMERFTVERMVSRTMENYRKVLA
jgi:Glycosyl transferases group 1/Glycosyltransferase Family 4